MPIDNSPQSSETVSVTSTNESMPDVLTWVQILESYITEHLTGGVHDDGLSIGQSDCLIVRKALRMMEAAIRRARQAGEPDPVFA